MSDKRIDALKEVAGQIAESVLFMFADPIEEAVSGDEEEDWCCVSIEYQGSRVGGLTLWLPIEANAEITSNMLGDDVDAQESADAVKEFVNMICGNFITKLEGNQAVIDLRPPVAKRVTASAKGIAAKSQLGLNLDDYTVFFRIEEQANAEAA